MSKKIDNFIASASKFLLLEFTSQRDLLSRVSANLSMMPLLPGEFWLGLKKIHSLVTQGNSVLHIQLEDWKQGRRFNEYRFYLNGPERNYTIHLTQLSGDSPDPMSNHTGMMFSTKDSDNNKHQNSICAHNFTGAAALHVFILM